MAKLKNPPPKRVRLSKNLGNETRKFLNYLDLMLMHEAPRQLRDVIVNNGLTTLRANWNTWWDEERVAAKARRRRKVTHAREEPRPCDPGELRACPRCGEKAASFCHPAYDGGTYVRCDACLYSPQEKTWAPDDSRAMAKWNKL